MAKLTKAFIDRVQLPGSDYKIHWDDAVKGYGLRVITIHANSDAPTCFVMRSEEVRAAAQKDLNGDAWWLNPPAYDRDEYREAWGRIGLDR